LLPHALACATLIEEDYFAFADAARLLTNTGGYLREHLRCAEAKVLLQRALAIYEHMPEPPYQAYGVALNELAILYRAQGRYAEAKPLYQRALAIREHVLGPDHPWMANILKLYASLLRKTQQMREAETLERRASAIQAKSTS
jgi:tetratricopeptide (TPR) repeat protein